MDISAAITREVERRGEDITLYNYSQSGTDEYGDPTFSVTTTNARAILQYTGAGTDRRDAAGAEETGDFIIRIPATEPVHEPRDDHPRPTEVERDKTGNRFRVQAKTQLEDGLYECECSLQ